MVIQSSHTEQTISDRLMWLNLTDCNCCCAWSDQPIHVISFCVILYKIKIKINETVISKLKVENANREATSSPIKETVVQFLWIRIVCTSCTSTSTYLFSVSGAHLLLWGVFFLHVKFQSQWLIYFLSISFICRLTKMARLKTDWKYECFLKWLDGVPFVNNLNDIVQQNRTVVESTELHDFGCC